MSFGRNKGYFFAKCHHETSFLVTPILILLYFLRFQFSYVSCVFHSPMFLVFSIILYFPFSYIFYFIIYSPVCLVFSILLCLLCVPFSCVSNFLIFLILSILLCFFCFPFSLFLVIPVSYFSYVLGFLVFPIL